MKRFCPLCDAPLHANVKADTCPTCRKRSRSLLRLLGHHSHPGRQVEKPQWLEKQIQIYAARAEQGLPLFD